MKVPQIYTSIIKFCCSTWKVLSVEIKCVHREILTSALSPEFVEPGRNQDFSSRVFPHQCLPLRPKAQWELLLALACSLAGMQCPDHGAFVQWLMGDPACLQDGMEAAEASWPERGHGLAAGLWLRDKSPSDERHV